MEADGNVLQSDLLVSEMDNARWAGQRSSVNSCISTSWTAFQPRMDAEVVFNTLEYLNPFSLFYCLDSAAGACRKHRSTTENTTDLVTSSQLLEAALMSGRSH